MINFNLPTIFPDIFFDAPSSFLSIKSRNFRHPVNSDINVHFVPFILSSQHARFVGQHKRTKPYRVNLKGKWKWQRETKFQIDRTTFQSNLETIKARHVHTDQKTWSNRYKRWYLIAAVARDLYVLAKIEYGPVPVPLEGLAVPQNAVGGPAALHMWSSNLTLDMAESQAVIKIQLLPSFSRHNQVPFFIAWTF